MTQQLFIAEPSDSTRNALSTIGLEYTDFTDAGSEGVLTLAPIENFDTLSQTLREIADSFLVPDRTPAEYEGLIRARVLSRDEYKKYGFSLAGEALCYSLERTFGEEAEPVSVCRGQLASDTRALSLLLQERAEGFDPRRDLRERLASEFEAMRTHPQVSGIEVGDFQFFNGETQMGLKISTHELLCKNPSTGLIHSIGEFDIYFAFVQKDNDLVKWLNRTRRVDGYERNMQAPHVFSAGQACLGNMKGQFLNLINRGDFFAAVDMAIKFIESVNLDDRAGEHLPKWPVKA